MKFLQILFGTAVITWLLASCVSAPMTDRKQVNLKSNKVLEREAAAAYQQFLSQNTLSNDSAKIKMVYRATERLLDATKVYYTANSAQKEFDRFRWEVNVIESNEINAFCMPGGKMAVFTGLFQVVKNEDQLAAVMAHEIGHALAKHGNERASHGIMAEVGAIGLDVLLAKKGVSTDTRQLAQLGYSMGAVAGFLLPFSRAHEKEADKIGLYLMSIAGYEPEAAPQVWQNMTDKLGDSKTAFFQTHPTNRKRKEELEATIPEAVAFAKPYQRRAQEEAPAAVAEPLLAATDPTIPVASYSTPKPTSVQEQSFSGGFADRQKAKTEQETPIAKQPEKPAAKQPEPVQHVTAPVAVKASEPNTPSANFTNTSPELTVKKTMKVQVMAISNMAEGKQKMQKLEGLDSISRERVTVNGKEYLRILLGDFEDAYTAAATLNEVMSLGFKDAFIVTYEDGNRIATMK